MVVADQHEIDLRQIVEPDAGCRDALWTEAERAGSLRIDGVGEDVEAVRLDEDAGVADPRHDHAIAVDQRCGAGRCDRHALRPFGTPVVAGQVTPEEAGAAAARGHAHRVLIAIGIEEALPVVMVAFVAFVIDAVEEARDDRHGEAECDDERQDDAADDLQCQRHGSPFGD